MKATKKRAGEIQIAAKGRGREVIDVVVGGNGEARIDPKNFAGRKCEGIVQDLATALDGTVVSFYPKAEFYGTASVGIREVARG